MKLYIIIVALLLSITSCEKILVEKNGGTDNLAIFDEYAKLVEEKYAMLEFKKVDIISLRDSIKQTIGDESQAELFEKLAFITRKLHDGHSSLDSPDSSAGFDIQAGYPVGFHLGILAEHYIGQKINPDMIYLENDVDIIAAYGFLPQNKNIAYIWIPSWDVEILDDEIESIFLHIKDAKALIFDMRQNTGGDPSLATKFAAYFLDQPVYTGFERFKTGPGINDFSDSKVNLQPAKSDNKFLKPVAVLTDRLCYSASTTFAYSVNPLSNVTFIGQRTGGGSGSVADGYLANGWKWSLSTSEFIDHLDNHLDDGFNPDIAVALDTLDKSQDEVIERAILELQ